MELWFREETIIGVPWQFMDRCACNHQSEYVVPVGTQVFTEKRSAAKNLHEFFFVLQEKQSKDCRHKTGQGEKHS